MKIILGLITIFFMFTTSSFAGTLMGSGTGSGAGPGKVNNASQIQNPEAISAEDSLLQVYFMKQQQAEVQFAVSDAKDGNVEILSLRPEEMSGNALLESLKKSRQTKKWESLKTPEMSEIKARLEVLQRERAY